MLIFFKTNEEIEGEKCSERGSHQKRKNSFACRSAEKEQSQPQLYGTSYFLVRNTPIGRHIADSAAGPVAQGKHFCDATVSTVGGTFDEILEHDALVFGGFARGNVCPGLL